MVATALHKVATAEITMQWVELKAADATDLRIEAAMQPRRRATPPESEPEEDQTDSSDIESSSEEPTDSSDVESNEPEEPEESTDSSGVESSEEENS